MKSYRPGGALRRAGPIRAGARRAGARGASAAWAPIPTPTAALLLRDLRMPDFRDYAVEVPKPGAVDGRSDARAGAVPPRRHEAQSESAELPRLRPGRDRLQPLERRLRGDRPLLGRPRFCPRTTTSRPTAASWRCSASTSARAGSKATCSPGATASFHCYEAFIHIVDSMFNQHAKWLKIDPAHPVAAAHRVAQLPAHLARLAPGPQRLLAPGSRASSTTWSTRRPRSSASTCRPTPTRCSR